MNAPRRRLALPPRPHGSVSVPFAVMLPVILGLMGLAIDLSLVYARNAELQNVADGAAVAAARELNGTAAGVTRAKTKATQVAEGNYFKMSTQLFSSGDNWSTAALYLSSAPTGAAWLPADGVTSDAGAAGLLYAKVDTAALNGLAGAPGVIATSFIRAVNGPGASRNEVSAAPVAVAGRTGMRVTPLAVCALNTTRLQGRASAAGTELVELGYRRGVAYDLLSLNPAGPVAQNFLLNPITGGDLPSQAWHFASSTIKPFFCSGNVAFANLRAGAQVHVQPLAGLDLHDWLNSRFGDYPGGSACSAREGAPPDTNVREFKSPYSWMATTLPAALSTTTTAAPNARLTVADLAVGAASAADPVTAAKFGPLWTYNKAVKYVAGSVTGAAIPTPATFAIGDWASLYQVSSPPPPSTSSYLATPYVKQFTAPSAGFAYGERRILNLALLNCSAPVGSTATVLGIGRFFMTSRATATAVYGEFAGLAGDETLYASVALHQ